MRTVQCAMRDHPEVRQMCPDGGLSVLREMTGDAPLRWAAKGGEDAQDVFGSGGAVWRMRGARGPRAEVVLPLSLLHADGLPHSGMDGHLPVAQRTCEAGGPPQV